ncbi:MAG: hypothetical protein Kapaf2KO_16760 [Candidatus Kapaibacteriales bacterium]
MILFDILFQDAAGYLNSWFMILETIDSIFGSDILTDDHKFIFYQDNLGKAALPFTWFLFLVFHYLLAVTIKNFIDIGRSFYLNIRHTVESIYDEELA